MSRVVVRFTFLLKSCISMEYILNLVAELFIVTSIYNQNAHEIPFSLEVVTLNSICGACCCHCFFLQIRRMQSFISDPFNYLVVLKRRIPESKLLALFKTFRNTFLHENSTLSAIQSRNYRQESTCTFSAILVD